MEEKIRNIMSIVFQVNKKFITEETTIESVGQWDSLKHLNLIVSLEEEFGISISEEEMVKMDSFENIVNIMRGILKF